MSLTLDPAPTSPEPAARIQHQLDRNPDSAPADVINHALDLLEHSEASVSARSDDWLLRNREVISAALDESFASLERGDG